MEAVKEKTKYELVADRIEHMVQAGLVKSGEKIPSIRHIAKQVGVSMMTAVEGYRLLEDKGIIESRPKSGYFIRPKHLRQASSWTRLPEPKTESIKIKAININIPDSVKLFLDQAENKNLISFGAGLPAAEFFPSEQLSIRMARVVRNDPEGVNQYSLGQGELSLRTELAKIMIGAGCKVCPEHISITGGVTQGLLLALRAVTKPGDTVAVESPGFFGFFQMLYFLNLNVVEIPSNPQKGISVLAFEELLKTNNTISALILSPTYSNPTGAVMAEENKRKLAMVCEQYNVPVIEDDTYGELTFDETRPKPLKAYLPDQVIYLGNLSKILSPGYRIAWMVGGKYQEDLKRCHNMAALANPKPTQLALASFLHDGGMQKHLRRLRRTYEECIKVFQHEIARSFPDETRTTNPRGGHFLWLKLPEAVDSEILAKLAPNKGISLAPGTIFSANQFYRNYLRLNCAIPWSTKIKQAVNTVGQLVADQLQ